MSQTDESHRGDPFSIEGITALANALFAGAETADVSASSRDTVQTTTVSPLLAADIGSTSTAFSPAPGVAPDAGVATAAGVPGATELGGIRDLAGTPVDLSFLTDGPTAGYSQADTGSAAPTASHPDTEALTAVAEGIDEDELLHKAAGAPTDTSSAQAQLTGDHPFLQGIYTQLKDALDVDDAGAGEHALDALQSDEFAAIAHEFTGQPLSDPVELLSVPAAPDEASPETPHFSPQMRPSGSSDEVPELDIPPTTTGFNAERYRADFPILSERINGHELVWLDNGATTQKPQKVIDRLSYFYEHENSNVHRTAHTLAGRATDAYEGARDKVRGFINAPSSDEVVWVRGTTEGMNLLANTYGEQNVCEGDEILISYLEHHANIVPWQMLCQRKGAKLRVAPVDDTGQIILSEFERLITPRTKLISFTQVSNALGTITPAKEMIEIAHRHGKTVVIDGAQGVLHMPVDVQELDCDFYVFSGHKMFAPDGIGVVWGKKHLLDGMPPWQGGGNMIDKVYFDHSTFQNPPWRFEAGTGSIADAVGLGAAVDYLEQIGMSRIGAHEHELLVYGTERLLAIPGLRIIGTARNKAGVLSFVIDGYEPEDVGMYLDQQGIAVRAGHHCAQPILRRFGVEGTVRAAFALYNTIGDVDRLADALETLVGSGAPLTGTVGGVPKGIGSDYPCSG